MNISNLSRGSVPAVKRDWTLLYVLDGDNDLREAATCDLVELDQHGSPDSVNVAAQLYRGELKWNLKNLGRKVDNLFKGDCPPAIRSDWRGLRTFEVRAKNSQGQTREIISGPDSQDPKPSDPNELQKFLAWGMKQYPAKNYAVILSGHGSQDGLLTDSAGDKMSFEQISSALKGAAEETGESVDVVLFDTCSTAGKKAENALRGATDFLVASPTKIRGGGWSESETLNFLENNPDASPENLATSFLSDAHTAVPESVVYDLR